MPKLSGVSRDRFSKGARPVSRATSGAVRVSPAHGIHGGRQSELGFVSQLVRMTTKPSEISNVDVAVYVLSTLGGAERTVYSEHIAARCHELARARFSWRLPEYREKGWPDKYIVKTALEDAKKNEYGGLVDGAYALDVARDGWRLTTKGAMWFKENGERVEKQLGLGTQHSSVPKRDAQRFLRQMHAQLVYQAYRKGGLDDITRFAFTDMLNCSPDASEDVVISKFKRLRATAELVGDSEIVAFLDACKSKFLSADSTAPAKADS
jgi:hypothetical protein